MADNTPLPDKDSDILKDDIVKVEFAGDAGQDYTAAFERRTMFLNIR
jgi:hypothetical protein